MSKRNETKYVYFTQMGCLVRMALPNFERYAKEMAYGRSVAPEDFGGKQLTVECPDVADWEFSDWEMGNIKDVHPCMLDGKK